MELGPHLWLGLEAGKPLRHAKADKTGVKAERPNLRMVAKSSFKSLRTMDEVVEEMFGSLR